MTRQPLSDDRVQSGPRQADAARLRKARSEMHLIARMALRRLAAARPPAHDPALAEWAKKHGLWLMDRLREAWEQTG